MTIADRVNDLKSAILDGSDPDGSTAIKTVDHLLEYLEAQRSMMKRYAEFAQISGDTLAIPAPWAAWLNKAICHDLGHQAYNKLKHVSVKEYAGRHWLGATDGYRLHAHVTDLKLGVYLMVDNMLRRVDDKHVDWVSVIPCMAETVTIGECNTTRVCIDPLGDEYESFLAWNFDGQSLDKANKGTPYRLQPGFWDDALSLGGNPSFALGELRENETEQFLRRMVITWPDAIAVIMPARPE